MNYRKYKRSFVMLEEQTKGFCADKGSVKGYLKVETGNNKGALRCVVQNLKYFSQGDYIYKLILFGKKEGLTIHALLGGLIINRKGNGETYFRFKPLDVDGKGNRYDDFTIAIVAAVSEKDNKESLHPVLKGIISNKKEAFRKKEDAMRGQDIKNSIHSKDEGNKKITGGKRSPKRTVYNSFYNEYLLQYCEYTCKVADSYEEVTPFEKDKTGAAWRKIEDIRSLPMISPGAFYFSDVYKHYLFGAKPGKDGVAEEFFFAIPGRFTQEEQPDAGQSGFVYWQPVVGATWKETDYGYWIVAIDAKTGCILEVSL